MKLVTVLALSIIALLVAFSVVLFLETLTEEQVSIQEDEMEDIGSYKRGAFMGVWKIHDNRDNVTCWIHGEKGGMSCIPDHLLSP